MDKKWKENSSSYIAKTLQKSMITGIPQIASAGNRPKAVFRSLIFLLCTLGFIYQSFSFMNMYWKYPTTIDIEIVTPLKEHRPAMTFCTDNGVMVTKLCDDPDALNYDINCRPRNESEIANWCKSFPRYCKSRTKVQNDISLKDLIRITYLPWNKKKPWMIGIWDFVLCQEQAMKKGTFLYTYCKDNNVTFKEIGCPNQNNLPEYCATINTLIDRPKQKLEKVASDLKILIYLNHLLHEAPKYLQEKLVYASFHNPYQVVNPIYDGYKLEGNSRYFISLKKIVKKLLPYPYDTDCFDYLTQWKARGGKGAVSQKDCVQECQKNLSLARHGCVLNSVHSPGQELRCPYKLIDYTLRKDSEECAKKKCKPACYEEYYLIDMEKENEFVKSKPQCKTETRGSILSKIFINMNGMETTFYTYNPKYQNVETFSYLGGYVGIWLGISLMAVFDFIDTINLLLKFPYRRYLLIKRNKKCMKDFRKSPKLV